MVGQHREGAVLEDFFIAVLLSAAADEEEAGVAATGGGGGRGYRQRGGEVDAVAIGIDIIGAHLALGVGKGGLGSLRAAEAEEGVGWSEVRLFAEQALPPSAAESVGIAVQGGFEAYAGALEAERIGVPTVGGSGDGGGGLQRAVEGGVAIVNPQAKHERGLRTEGFIPSGLRHGSLLPKQGENEED